MSQPKINIIHAKSVLNKTNLPGVDYSVNPYVGCEHACAYCYAANMRRYTGHSKDPWGEFLDVKINAPGILRKQLRRRKKGLCLKCGYDLTGNTSGACPECGERI